MHAFEDQLHKNKTCIIIPTYNNAGTLKAVLSEFIGLANSVFVINDGSTDDTESILLDFKEFNVLSYSRNIGKGHALNLGFKEAFSKGFLYAITFDSDGQHLSQDIPKFIEKIKLFPGALLVGSRNLEAENMPGKNTFGNKFSNFWFHIETGVKLPDTQSGFRLYPLKSIQKLRLFTRKYEFELEVLVRSAWHRIPVHPVPISVYYPPEGERVSHFKPFRDFTRISIMNTVLVLLGLLVYRPINFIKSLTRQNIKHLSRQRLFIPMKALKRRPWRLVSVYLWVFFLYGDTKCLSPFYWPIFLNSTKPSCCSHQISALVH